MKTTPDGSLQPSGIYPNLETLRGTKVMVKRIIAYQMLTNKLRAI